MKSILVLTVACAIALNAAAVRAQGADVVLRVDITKDGTLVASPQLRLKSGQQGMISIDERDVPAPSPRLRGLRERITLTPTLQGESISIAYDITSDSKRFRPSLVISKDLKGSLEWASTEGQAIRLSVSWVQ